MYRYHTIMTLIFIFIVSTWFVSSTEITTGQEPTKLIQAKDGSGIIGYKDTPILPWCGFHVHDPDRPVPPKVTPGLPCTEEKAGTAPSDAIKLFDGTDLTKWEPSDWKIENGELIAVSGNLATKQAFGDCQLHLEWQTPNPPQGHMFDRGNNGVKLMGLFEIQIFDSYSEKLYPDGQAASVYGQTPPLVNACRKRGNGRLSILFSSLPSSRTASSKKKLMSQYFTTACSSTTIRKSTVQPGTGFCQVMTNQSPKNSRWNCRPTIIPCVFETSG